MLSPNSGVKAFFNRPIIFLLDGAVAEGKHRRMKLIAYRSRRRMTQAEAARELGISKSYFCQLETGQAVASLPLAARIRDWSAGRVTLDDLAPSREAADE